MVAGILGVGGVVNPMSTTWMSRLALSKKTLINHLHLSLSDFESLVSFESSCALRIELRIFFQQEKPTKPQLLTNQDWDHPSCWGALKMGDQWLNRDPPTNMQTIADVYATLSVNHHFWGQPRQPPYFKNRSVEQCSFRKRNDDPGPWHNKKGTWYQFGTLFQRS